MALSDRQLLNALSQTPFADSAELAGILVEPHATVRRALSGLLADGIFGKVSQGTATRPDEIESLHLAGAMETENYATREAVGLGTT